MDARPQMLRLYLSGERTGDGYRTAFVLSRRQDTATILVPSLVVTLTVPLSLLAKGRPLPYRPRVVRDNLLRRVRLCRRHRRRFPRAATVRLLRMLGAGRAAIDETVNVPALPEALAARAHRAHRAERAALLADVTAAIRDGIEFHEADPPAPPCIVRRVRPRPIHPDQLALAL